MAFLRATALAVGGLVSVLLGVGVAATVGTRTAVRPLRPIAAGLAARAFDAEKREAGSLGMTAAEQGDTPLAVLDGQGSWTRPLAIGAGECVAVVVATSGYQAPAGLSLEATPSVTGRVSEVPVPLAAERRFAGVAGQVQWCEREAHTRYVLLETRAIDPARRVEYQAGAVRWAVFRGPWARVGGVTHLRRGVFSSEALRDLGADAARDEAATVALPAGARPLGPVLDVTMAGARLIPANAATYRVLYHAAQGSLGRSGDVAVNPRIDPSPAGGDPRDPIARGLGLPLNLHALTRELAGTAGRAALDPPGPIAPVHDPVVASGDGRFERVLAVVDRSALGTPCVALRFTRLLYAHDAVVHRVDVAARRFTELPRVANVATDTVCPAEGVAAYAVPDTDQEQYRLQLYALPAAP